MRKLIFIAVVLMVATRLYWQSHESGFVPAMRGEGGSIAGLAEQALATAFENRRSNVQVQGGGQVTRILSDDNEGSRHQRFIVQLASGQTLLLAHNIDLADRVASLKVGDRVAFNGEYEWNPKGGVVHWTHRDSGGTHVDGWIEHSGHRYQ
jgi:hypothetical protein